MNKRPIYAIELYSKASHKGVQLITCNAFKDAYDLYRAYGHIARLAPGSHGGEEFDRVRLYRLIPGQAWEAIREQSY